MKSVGQEEDVMIVDERLLIEKDDKRKLRNETVNSSRAQPVDSYSFFCTEILKT